MPLRNEPLDWQLKSQDSYSPIIYKGEIAGLFISEYANRITTILNGEETLRRALKKACYDLLYERGMETSQVKELMKKYIAIAERPKYGTPAIAILLSERKKELDLNSQKFIAFCDSYKLSPDALKEISLGQEIDDSLIEPLSRILGKSISELRTIRDGSSEEEEI